jgi:hypothetical protein
MRISKKECCFASGPLVTLCAFVWRLSLIGICSSCYS